jgi:hypothetical protein
MPFFYKYHLSLPSSLLPSLNSLNQSSFRFHRHIYLHDRKSNGVGKEERGRPDKKSTAITLRRRRSSMLHRSRSWSGLRARPETICPAWTSPTKDIRTVMGQFGNAILEDCDEIDAVSKTAWVTRRQAQALDTPEARKIIQLYRCRPDTRRIRRKIARHHPPSE